MLTARLDAPAMGRPRMVRHSVRAAPPHTPLPLFRFCFAMLLGGDVLLFSIPLDLHDLVVLRHSEHRGTHIPHSYARHGHRMSEELRKELGSLPCVSVHIISSFAAPSLLIISTSQQCEFRALFRRPASLTDTSKSARNWMKHLSPNTQMKATGRMLRMLSDGVTVQDTLGSLIPWTLSIRKKATMGK